MIPRAPRPQWKSPSRATGARAARDALAHPDHLRTPPATCAAHSRRAPAASCSKTHLQTSWRRRFVPSSLAAPRSIQPGGCRNPGGREPADALRARGPSCGRQPCGADRVEPVVPCRVIASRFAASDQPRAQPRRARSSTGRGRRRSARPLRVPRTRVLFGCRREAKRLRVAGTAARHPALGHERSACQLDERERVPVRVDATQFLLASTETILSPRYGDGTRLGGQIPLGVHASSDAIPP
jgi:hypothetical protein